MAKHWLEVWKKEAKEKRWWFFTSVKTEVKRKMCWYFLSSEKKSEKNKVLIYSTKQNWAVLCFYANNNTKLRQSTLGANFNLLKKFVWYPTNFFCSKRRYFCKLKKTQKVAFLQTFIHFCNFLPLYQSVSKPLLSICIIITFYRFQN